MLEKKKTARPRPLPIPVPADRRRFRQRLLTWYGRHGRDLPWRKTDDPYHILVSEIMLQQTQVDRVLPKYAEWLDKYPSMEVLAKAFPQTIFVLEHAGMLEDTSPEGWQTWREGMKALADCPNVNIKLSGLGTFVHAVRADLMKAIVTETVALFGADRCFYGSNFPIEKLWTDYKSLHRAFRDAIADLGEREQAAILHDTAARLYRLK